MQHVAARQLDVVGDARLRRRHGTAEIAPAHAELDGDVAPRRFAVDEEGAIAQFDPGHGADRHAAAVRRIHQQPADLVRAGTRALRQAQEQVVDPLAFQHLGLRIAADGVEHHAFDVGDVEAVTLRSDTVHCQIEGGLAQFLEDADVGHALHLLQLRLHFLGLGLQRGQIVAEDLHRVLALDAGQGLVDVVLDVLREVDVDAGNAVEVFLQAIDHVLAVDGVAELRRRLEVDPVFLVVDASGVGAVVGAADLPRHRAHLRLTGDLLANFIGDARRVGKIHRVRQGHADPQIVFLQRRQEAGAEADQGHTGEAEKQQRHQAGAQRIADQHLENGAVAPLHPVDEARRLHHPAAAEQGGRRRRDEAGAERDGGEQGQAHGEGHRLEDLALDAAQQEQRRVSDDDDGGGEDHGALHFRSGQAEHQARLLPAALQVLHDVLDDDDRGVDDQAEVDGAERDQIGRHIQPVHAGEGDAQAHRDDRRDGQRHAHIAEENP